MDKTSNNPPQYDTRITLGAIGACWVAIAWLNTSYENNPVVFIVLTGLLVVIVLAGAIVLIERNRQKRMQGN